LHRAGDERRRARNEAVEDEWQAPPGGAHDDADEGGDLEAADRGEDAERIGRVGPVDAEASLDGLDLSRLYQGIRSVAGGPGAPATDPRILTALWLYATLEGVGSARALIDTSTVPAGRETRSNPQPAITRLASLRIATPKCPPDTGASR
jgi:hypothetical protein